MKVKHCSDKLSLINLLTCVSFLLLVVRVTFSADVIRTDDASLDLQSSAHVAHQEQPKSTSDTNIVINSIEDGLLSSGKIESERHHYDQPIEQAERKDSHIAVATTIRPTKPEPRTQQDDQQHQLQQDPMILDHRPSPIETPTQSAAVSQDYVNSHHHATTASPSNSASNIPIQAPSTSLQSQYQPVQVSSASNWYLGPSSNQQSYATQSPPQQQQRAQGSSNVQSNNNFGSATSSSNQILTVTHPTSINSIISDHQQQPFTIQPTGVSSNQIQSNAQPQQAVMQTLNGQPVILVNPNSIGPNGGRRISISNWLRGISNMLANIFNRRDHGQLTGQANAPFGNWIQLGPNAPHWLTQAQSAIQQQQYGSTAASSNRYTFLPGPQMTIQQQSSNAVPVSMQPANIMSGQAQPNYQMGDLQASGSMNYVAIQAPPNSMIQQPQQQQQQAQAIHGSSSTATSSLMMSGENSARNSQSSNNANSHPQQQSHSLQQVSSSQPSAINQPWLNNSSQQSTTQTSFGSKTANSDQNLPLAHYSRYSSNPSD